MDARHGAGWPGDPHLVGHREAPPGREHLSRVAHGHAVAEDLGDFGQRSGEVDITEPFYWDTVIGAMNEVMQGPQGTARAVGMGAPYKMAGKSGTAQVFSIAQEEEYDEEEIEERLRDHALFISFAPLDNPQIAVAVVVENGSSGSRVAAPIARAIMDQFLGYNDAAD